MNPLHCSVSHRLYSTSYDDDCNKSFGCTLCIFTSSTRLFEQCNYERYVFLVSFLTSNNAFKTCFGKILILLTLPNDANPNPSNEYHVSHKNTFH